MDLYNPKKLIELCQKYRIIPSKKYGQNFLISKKVVDEIIEKSDLKKTDTVVEVGPGFGVLTFAMAEKVKKVIAFEIEKKLEGYWEENKLENVEIIWGNVLNKMEELILSTGRQELKNYRVVANLPYQITSNLIRKFLEAKNPPSEMVLMVQKEVGERICAKPACPSVAGKRRRGQMSLLAVSVQYYSEPKILFNVSRNKFFPSPKVDSVVIKLKIDKTEKNINDKDFFQVVKIGFASKRKMLIKNLKVLEKDKAKLENIFEKVGLDKKVRAQELSVEQWVELTKLLV